MAWKWFQLVGENGNPVTSADAVVVDIEDVAALRDAVFAKVSRALPATVIAADLTVFDTNGVSMAARDSLAHIDETVTLVVQVPMQEQKVEAEMIEEQPDFQPHPNRLKRWADLNKVLDRNRKK